VDVLPDGLLEWRDLGGRRFHFGSRPQRVQIRRQTVAPLVLGDGERLPLLV
jgi:hypothetical protein